MGVVEDRIEALREMVEEMPEDALGWFMLGSELVKAGRAGEAVPAFERAVAVDEAYSAAWRGLAEARAASGADPRDAWETARRVAEAQGDKVVLTAAEHALARLG